MPRATDIFGTQYTEDLSQRVGGENPVFKLGHRDPLFSKHPGFLRARKRTIALRKIKEDAASSPELLAQVEEAEKPLHWRFIYYQKSKTFLTEQPTPENRYLRLYVVYDPAKAKHNKKKSLEPAESEWHNHAAGSRMSPRLQSPGNPAMEDEGDNMEGVDGPPEHALAEDSQPEENSQEEGPPETQSPQAPQAPPCRDPRTTPPPPVQGAPAPAAPALQATAQTPPSPSTAPAALRAHAGTSTRPDEDMPALEPMTDQDEEVPRGTPPARGSQGPSDGTAKRARLAFEASLTPGPRVRTVDGSRLYMFTGEGVGDEERVLDDFLKVEADRRNYFQTEWDYCPKPRPVRASEGQLLAGDGIGFVGTSQLLRDEVRRDLNEVQGAAVIDAVVQYSADGSHAKAVIMWANTEIERIEKAKSDYVEKGEGLMQKSRDAERRAKEKAQAAVTAIREAQDAAIDALDAELLAQAHHRGAEAIYKGVQEAQDKYLVEIMWSPIAQNNNMKARKAAALALPYLQRGMVATGGCLHPEPEPYITQGDQGASSSTPPGQGSQAASPSSFVATPPATVPPQTPPPDPEQLPEARPGIAGFTGDGCYRYPSGALTSADKYMQELADGEDDLSE